MGSKADVAFSIAAYAVCSGSMLFFNKMSVSMAQDMEYRLLPGPISCMQLTFAVVFCAGLHGFGLVRFKRFSLPALKMYSVYCLLFVGSVYASMKALEGSNVETQIVFRSATPLTVSVLDALFLGRELPSRKSCLSLVATVLGALAYVATDAEFKVNGFQAYAWISLYYLLICVEMTLGKAILSAVKLEGVWASVLLTNGISLPLLALLAHTNGEFDHFSEAAAATKPDQWAVIMAGVLRYTHTHTLTRLPHLFFNLFSLSLSLLGSV